MKQIFLTFLVFLLVWTPVYGQAEANMVRLKDIGKIIEERDNQLIGFGLVVGLRNSGDTKSVGYTQAAMDNMLSKMGVSSAQASAGRNVASVMVTATLPAFVKKGQLIPVTVSSLGDASSLVGGTLILTPLKGPDLRTYATAQGTVIVGGVEASAFSGRVYRNQSTVGRIPDGAIVEEQVPVTFVDQHNITIVLDQSNFNTVSRAVRAIQDNGFPGAQAIDANTIKIPLSDLNSSDLVQTIAQLENIEVEPDKSAKIVINSRTGTVVIGERVRLSPVALTHGNISIRIQDVQQGGFAAAGQVQEPIVVEEPASKIIYLNPTSTLSSLVNALNEIGATSKDLISIIQALKESNALTAEIEIL